MMMKSTQHPLAAATRVDRVASAIVLMCLYVGLIVCVNAIGKVLTAYHDPLQVVFFRHAGAGLLMFSVFVSRYGWRILRAARPRTQIARGLFAIVSSVLYFSALRTTSLATAAAISFTAPLVLTTLSGPLLHEKVDIHRWGAVLVGFTGAVIVVRPGFGGASGWGALMLLGSACCTGFYQLLTRKVAGQDRAETTAIWSGVVSGGSISLLVPFVWSTPSQPVIWALFIALGLIGGTGHFLLARAFERGPASLLSPFSYLQLVGATGTGFALYGDLPDAMTWLGAGVIVSAGLYIAWREQRR